MYSKVEKKKAKKTENKSRVIVNPVAQKKGTEKQGFKFVDNLSSIVVQNKLQENAKINPQDNKAVTLQLARSTKKEVPTKNGSKLKGPKTTKKKKNSSKIPFPWRYSGKDDYMKQTEKDLGGYVAYPSSGFKAEQYGGEHQGSFVVGSKFDDLQKGSKREVTQSSVMGMSPNEAAKALNLGDGDWEWLHLVAFSIKQTHTSGFSAESMRIFSRTNQPQQISENLVLGSAGANTAMLTYESLLKDVMRKNTDWTLSLSVQADVKRINVNNIIIPVAQLISFDFQFTTPDKKITPPIVLKFNPLSPVAPSADEYHRVCSELKKFIEEQQVPLPQGGIHGIHTTGFHAFK